MIELEHVTKMYGSIRESGMSRFMFPRDRQ